MSDRRKKPRMDEESCSIKRNFTLRLLMNGKEAGTLIGKGGATISGLRNTSGAIINISDNSTKERIVSVTGTGLNTVVDAFKLISQTLLENLYRTDTSDYPLTFQCVVPSAQCGSLIGVGGSQIKSIREASGAFVQIASDTLPMSSERMITISGKQENVDSCVKSICEIMIECPVHGSPVPYYPQNAGRTSSGYYSSQRNSSGPTRYSNDSSRRRKRSEDHDDYMSDTMAIPSQFAGSVIGKRGSKINETRSKSGASIKIADEAEGSSERVVTLGGTPEAVAMARCLIQTRIEFEQKKANGES